MATKAFTCFCQNRIFKGEADCWLKSSLPAIVTAPNVAPIECYGILRHIELIRFFSLLILFGMAAISGYRLVSDNLRYECCPVTKRDTCYEYLEWVGVLLFSLISFVIEKMARVSCMPSITT